MKINRFIKIAFARALGLTVLFAITMIAMLPEASRAQCPPDSWGTGIGGDVCWGSWAGPSTSAPVELPGTTCYVTYTYCTRSCNDPAFGFYTSVVIESITPVPGCAGCNGLTPDQMIKLLLQSMETTGSSSVGLGGPPPCANGWQYIVTYAMDCWEDVPYKWTDGQWYNNYITCGDPNDYCKTTCQYCQNPNGSWSTTCSGTSHDDGTCTPLPTPDTWLPYTCYDIQVCGGPN